MMEDFDEDSIYNPVTRRGAKIVPFGIALYQFDESRIGTHVGNVGTESEAEAWVAGHDIPNIMRVWAVPDT